MQKIDLTILIDLFYFLILLPYDQKIVDKGQEEVCACIICHSR